MKTLITPGRLYNKLTAEFRQVCCKRCTQCVLPVPSTVYDSRGRATWILGDLPDDCEECAPRIEEIVRRNQALYELMDPLAGANLVRDFYANRQRPH